MEIILIGFMGSGKTTVGSLLASELALPLTDLDQAIVDRSGKTIPAIFAADGEAGFRQVEHQTLEAVLASRQGILATGGGTPLRLDNRQLLKADPAPVILLKASPAETARRIQEASDRPLAKNLDAAGLGQLLAQRQARYEESADYTIATDGRTPQEVASEVRRLIGK